MSRIALFGGKFDPPHMAHRQIISLLFEKQQVDEVWVLLATAHPFGYQPTELTHRLNMVELMVNPLRRSKEIRILNEGDVVAKRPHYTVDILETLHQKHPENHYILAIGEDNWKDRDKWHNFEKIEKLAQVVVFGRGEKSDIPFSLPDISSTEIKELVASGGDVHSVLPEGVFDYIEQHGLYR